MAPCPAHTTARPVDASARVPVARAVVINPSRSLSEFDPGDMAHVERPYAVEEVYPEWLKWDILAKFDRGVKGVAHGIGRNIKERSMQRNAQRWLKLGTREGRLPRSAQESQAGGAAGCEVLPGR